ncbi:MAG TPA: hypothetical protein VF522_13180 [Ramlibacter sp.]|uniref:hypothetical protein n=1 Tax=Ramlibacter sp. TaxID=1917967 RepID=UPI002ED06676
MSDARRFRIEVDADGQPFVWEGPATTEATAFREAATQLVDEFPMLHVDRLRVVSCIEVPA